jgi:excisionase family DNA binding protein
VVFELDDEDRDRLGSGLGSGRLVAVRTELGEVRLPPEAQRAVQHLLGELTRGTRVHVLASDRDLTTQETAELLGVSRTFVVRLIDGGKLPAHRAGSHRRVRAIDAVAYARRRAERLAAVDAVAEGDRTGGLEYR